MLNIHLMNIWLTYQKTLRTVMNYHKNLNMTSFLNILINYYIWQLKMISTCFAITMQILRTFRILFILPIDMLVYFICVLFFPFATCFSSYTQLMTTNTHMVRLLWICHDTHFFHCSLIKLLIKEQFSYFL